LGRPERCARTAPSRNLPNGLVAVSTLLLIDICETSRQTPSSRDVYPLAKRVEVNTVHALRSWEVSDFLARLRVHDDHFSRSMSSNKQPRCCVVKCGVAWLFARYSPCRNNLSLAQIDHVKSIGDGTEHKERGP